MVIVSHRLSSLTECDQILVMEQGKVVDIGPHDVLLERCCDLSPALGAAEPPSRSRGPRPAAVLPKLSVVAGAEPRYPS